MHVADRENPVDGWVMGSINDEIAAKGDECVIGGHGIHQ